LMSEFGVGKMSSAAGGNGNRWRKQIPQANEHLMIKCGCVDVESRFEFGCCRYYLEYKARDGWALEEMDSAAGMRAWWTASDGDPEAKVQTTRWIDRDLHSSCLPPQLSPGVRSKAESERGATIPALEGGRNSIAVVVEDVATGDGDGECGGGFGVAKSVFHSRRSRAQRVSHAIGFGGSNNFIKGFRILVG
jgi:hypothetical protein